MLFKIIIPAHSHFHIISNKTVFVLEIDSTVLLLWMIFGNQLRTNEADITADAEPVVC